MIRKLILVIGTLCLLVGAASAIPSNYTSHPGAIFYAPMNGTAGSTTFYDVYGNTITNYNGTSINSTWYQFNNASYFDGVHIGQNLTISPKSTYNLTGDFTISMFVNSSEYSIDNSYRRILAPPEYQTSNSLSLLFFDYAGNSASSNLSVYTSSGVILGSIPVANGAPHRIMLTRSGSSLKLWVDGVQSGSTYTTSTTFDKYATNGFTLGTAGDGSGRYSGFLDDVYIVNGTAYNASIAQTREFLVNPASTFTSNVTSGDTPLSVGFFNLTNDEPTHSWSFTNVTGNNTEVVFSTVQNPSIILSTGNYSINYTVVNQYGISSSYAFVNVSPPPSPHPIFSATPSIGLVPLLVSFNDTSTNYPTMWNISFGSGEGWYNSTAFPSTNITHNYTSIGNYTVNWSATNTYGTGYAQSDIQVCNAATSSFSLFNNAGTAPFTTYLYDVSTNLTPGPVNFSWDLGDGNTSTSANLYFTWNRTGTYNVTHTVSNGLSSSTSFTNVTVGTPTPPVVAPVASFYGGPQTGSVPLTVFFTDASSNTPTSWNWSFGDGAYSTLQNPQHQYTSSGFKTVSLNATNSAGSNITIRAKFVKVS